MNTNCHFLCMTIFLKIDFVKIQRNFSNTYLQKNFFDHFYFAVCFLKKHRKIKFFMKSYRDDRIRTCDTMLPKHMRYQAALHPVCMIFELFSNFSLNLWNFFKSFFKERKQSASSFCFRIKFFCFFCLMYSIIFIFVKKSNIFIF